MAFHRDVSRSPQLFVFDVAGRRLRQMTTSGRNEDPTWAPDGRHIAFISDRTGRRQIWIIDMDTGRVRQLHLRRWPGFPRGRDACRNGSPTQDRSDDARSSLTPLAFACRRRVRGEKPPETPAPDTPAPADAPTPAPVDDSAGAGAAETRAQGARGRGARPCARRRRDHDPLRLRQVGHPAGGQGEARPQGGHPRGQPHREAPDRGHADERGSDEYNLALGNRRAAAAKQYLVSKGVDGSRIETVSYGSERPLNPGSDEEA